MKYSRNFILTFALLLFAFSSNLAVAKGAAIKFSSLVSAISQTDDYEGTVTVSIHGIDVLVIINADTEIEEKKLILKLSRLATLSELMPSFLTSGS